MKFRALFAAGVVLAAVGCESAIEVDPVTVVPEERAFADAAGARAALAGAYDALQSTQYYGEAMYTFVELSSDNAQHTGTFGEYRDADRALITIDNNEVEIMWDAMYDAVNRANVLIANLPNVAGLAPADRDQMLGEAHFLRALAYHDLSKIWGGVPLKLQPVTSLTEAANISRATLAEVYTQVLADLTTAEGLLSNTTDPTKASLGAVRALRARVLLYRASPGPTGLGDNNWAAVEAAATAAMPGYTLDPDYTDLFTAEGDETPEDIFRLRFTAQDAYFGGYYYIVKTLGGRYELGPTANLRAHYAAEPTDERFAWNISVDPANAARFFGSKYPTPVGAEHPHVIRLAEVILIRAEARARQGTPAALLGAVADYNQLRVRAGLAPHTFGVEVTDQASVLAAVLRERRSELAFEADRWFDIVRRNDLATMQAHLTSLGRTFAANQMLYPIPQAEIDVTRDAAGQPRLTQNPGY